MVELSFSDGTAKLPYPPRDRFKDLENGGNWIGLIFDRRIFRGVCEKFHEVRFLRRSLLDL